MQLRKVKFPNSDKFYFEKVINVGSTVWYIAAPGLFVKCKVTEIETYFRDTSPGSYLFYDIDEPVGHSVGGDELFPSLEAAVSFFIDRLQNGFRDLLKEGCPSILPENLSLDNERKKDIDFIRSTQGKHAAPLEEWAIHYPKKERGVDWFTVWDLVTEEI
ncbi:MAG: hypothetical protein WC444_04235 [Candidatus Paceibacterota bacterium]